MIDPNFFTNAGPFSIGDLAARLGGQLALGTGDGSTNPDLMIIDLATLDEANGAELSMFGDRRYRAAFDQTRAGVILTHSDLVRTPPKCDAHLIFVPDPRLAFAEAAWLFYPENHNPFGIDSEIDDFIRGDRCRISKSAYIGRGATIGARTEIGANAVIGAGVVIGDDCVIGPNATIGYAIIGDRVHIDAGVVIGSQGFGFIPSPNGLRRVPQLGRVIIADNVEIGANCTVDRGAVGDTMIGQGTVIDNLVQIGHNVRIGKYCVLCGQSGIAGSTEIGDGVILGGGASIADHVKIGHGVKIGGKSGVAGNVEAGVIIGGYPAVPIRDWHRQTAGLKKMFSRTRRLHDKASS